MNAKTITGNQSPSLIELLTEYHAVAQDIALGSDPSNTQIVPSALSENIRQKIGVKNPSDDDYKPMSSMTYSVLLGDAIKAQAKDLHNKGNPLVPGTIKMSDASECLDLINSTREIISGQIKNDVVASILREVFNIRSLRSLDKTISAINGNDSQNEALVSSVSAQKIQPVL